MHNIYKVGGHCFKVSGSILCSVLERMAGFAPFEVAEGDDNVPEFFFMEGKSGNIPAFCERQYVFAHEGVEGIFGCTAGGYLLRLSPVNEKSLFLWTDNEVNVCYLCGNWSARLVRFALWIGYGIQTAMSDTVAIHSSCIVYRQKAVNSFEIRRGCLLVGGSCFVVYHILYDTIAKLWQCTGLHLLCE